MEKELPKKIRNWSSVLATRMKDRKRRGQEDIFVEEGIDRFYLLELFEEQGGKCFYSGLDMVAGDDFKAPSVDRIDSAGFYMKDNIVLCCRALNLAKNKYGVDEFIKFVEEIIVKGKVMY